MEGSARRISSTPIRRAVQSMKSAWVCDIQEVLKKSTWCVAHSMLFLVLVSVCMHSADYDRLLVVEWVLVSHHPVDAFFYEVDRGVRSQKSEPGLRGARVVCICVDYVVEGRCCFCGIQHTTEKTVFSATASVYGTRPAYRHTVDFLHVPYSHEPLFLYRG